MLELHNRNLLKSIKSCKLDFHEICVLGMQCKAKFVTSTKKSTQILEYIHSYVWGAAPITLHGGARFFVTFIDDFSRKVWVYFLKHKVRDFLEVQELKS